MNFAKYFGYKLIFIIKHAFAYTDANNDLILANNGDGLETGNKLKRRILGNVINHDNVFGKDPELEKSMKKMVHYLDLYKVEKKPTAKEWVDIKSSAADAVKGDCDSAEILFEQRVIPRNEYEMLVSRCGKSSTDKNSKNRYSSPRAKERRFPTPSTIVLKNEHTHNTEIAPPKREVKNRFRSTDPYSSSQEVSKDGSGEESYASRKYKPQNPELKRDALALLKKNVKPLLSKLSKIGTRPAIEAIKRIDKTKKLADDVINNAPEATEHLRDMNEENAQFCRENPETCMLESEMMSKLGMPHKPDFYEKEYDDPEKKSYTDRASQNRVTLTPPKKQGSMLDNETFLKEKLAKAILPEIINGVKEAVAREATKNNLLKNKPYQSIKPKRDRMNKGKPEKDFMTVEKDDLEADSSYKAEKSEMKVERNPESIDYKKEEELMKNKKHNDETDPRNQYKEKHISELKEDKNDEFIQNKGKVEMLNKEENKTTNNPINIEKEKARLFEEGLARRAELEEVRQARELAAQNVKRLGGSNKEAEKEANRTELVKSSQIEKEKEKATEDAKEKLEDQLNEKNAILEAEHIAKAHSGRNPVGKSFQEIVESAKALGEKLENIKPGYNKKIEEGLEIVDVIADNTTRIAINGTIIELPLNGVPDAKAKTAEEENIKNNLSALRDRLRNKITNKKINTGLVTLQGLEGVLNLPESCNTIRIKNGVVFFDQGGYENMLSQKIDTKPLFPVYSKGTDPLYYKANIKEMDMKIPSAINGVPQKVLLNDFETINIVFAKKIEVSNGDVFCEAWDTFSARMRPKVYQEINRGVDQVPESARNEFEKLEQTSELMKNTKVKIIKNMEGNLVAEIKPTYGVLSTLHVPDAINKAAMMAKRNAIREVEERRLNVAEQKNLPDYTNKFIESVEKDIKGNRRISPGMKDVLPNQSIDQHPEMKYKREGNDQETRAFNYVLMNHKRISNELEINNDAFLELLGRIDHKTVSFLFQHFLETANSFDIQRKFIELDVKDYMQTLRSWFGSKNALKMALEFFRAFFIVVKCPNNNATGYYLSCYNEKLRQYLFGNQQAPPVQQPNLIAKTVIIPVNPKNLQSPAISLKTLSPILQPPNSTQNSLKRPFCQPNQVVGCILQGTPLYFQQRNQPQRLFREVIKQ